MAQKKIDLYTATPEYQTFVASRRALPLRNIGRVKNSCVYYFQYKGPKSTRETALVMLVDTDRSDGMFFNYDEFQSTSRRRAGMPYRPVNIYWNKFKGSGKTTRSKSYFRFSKVNPGKQLKPRKYGRKPRHSKALGEKYFAAIRLDTLAPFLVAELISRYGKRRYVTMRDALKIKFYNGEGYRVFNYDYVDDFHTISPDDYVQTL
jgi:hypothetical protein